MAGSFKSVTLPTLYLVNEGPPGLERAMTELCRQASTAIADLSKGGVYMSQDFGKAGSNSLEKTAKGLGDLFKKKQ